jgi:hypothetical protein
LFLTAAYGSAAVLTAMAHGARGMQGVARGAGGGKQGDRRRCDWATETRCRAGASTNGAGMSPQTCPRKPYRSHPGRDPAPHLQVRVRFVSDSVRVRPAHGQVRVVDGGQAVCAVGARGGRL